MKKISRVIVVLLLSVMMISCNKELVKPYDHPFFYIHVAQASEINVQASRNEVVDYKVFFSTKLQYEPIKLQYEIIVGDGLKEGVDFEVLSNRSELVFKPGYFELPITIRWKANPLNPSANNYVIIRLLNNDKGITVGLPGPDKKQTELKINKI
ncbi:hypothetical protein SAMN05660841_00371 [Sphingobacterium nematocida]|uniref:DUF4843 domain-containing protein n=1 Tax=Sphingobacterium nematocida TaxID=1513896 RepID=A0A1T5B124_9SPHI|nr:hypothetical protein [Sphingobacterium nematocida]SKB40946.1 hypothetical protein SAMN05660841_00371 [Sphingobacterium nematocida]